MGVTILDFHLEGKIPVDRDKLNRIQRILDIIKRHDLRNIGGRPSSPGPLLISSVSSFAKNFANVDGKVRKIENVYRVSILLMASITIIYRFKVGGKFVSYVRGISKFLVLKMHRERKSV